MKVGLISTFRYHFFEAARELKRRGLLGRMVSGYTPKLIEREGLVRGEYVSFPYFTAATLASFRMGFDGPLHRWLEWQSHDALDARAAGSLNDCDVVMAMHTTGLRSGREAHRRGAMYVMDRPVVHIQEQDEILAAHYAEVGVRYRPIDPRKIEKEVTEYQECDLILVPSRLVACSMERRGIPLSKTALIPLGVDVSRFSDSGGRREDHFEVLFAGNVSLQKGIYILAKAVEKLQNPHLTLRIAGPVQKESEEALKSIQSHCTLEVLGKLSPQNLKEAMSRANAFVLPSIQDGFGAVVPQAMACGAPCIVSDMAGASEMIKTGENGLVFRSGDSSALAENLALLADRPALARDLGEAGKSAVVGLGGWDAYGTQLEEALRRLTGEAGPSRPRQLP
jgi:alpha-maltose-1-phosphate synthase